MYCFWELSFKIVALLRQAIFYYFFQPPTEKVHQIIARTAMFVNRHGGQSEIVLRVKQGDNPTFGFLMPDHHLHAYFRFLVDHPELLSEQKKTEGGLDQTGGSGRGGALSLLGSVYGSGEDEDGADIDASEFKRTATENTVETGDATAKNGSGPTNSCIIAVGKDETVSNHSLPPKEKVPLIKKNHSVTTVKTKTSSQTKSGDGALGSAHLTAEKVQASALASMPKVERTIVEPPSDMKKVVDKIVEFILRNGKEFESVLVEQDRKYGRFPFLLPTSLFHPYYLKVLHKAEEASNFLSFSCNGYFLGCIKLFISCYLADILCFVFISSQRCMARALVLRDMIQQDLEWTRNVLHPKKERVFHQDLIYHMTTRKRSLRW